MCCQVENRYKWKTTEEGGEELGSFLIFLSLKQKSMADPSHWNPHVKHLSDTTTKFLVIITPSLYFLLNLT